MRAFAPIVAGVALSTSPAFACIATSPAARAWAQCAYAEAHKTGDHRFVLSMAKATVWDKPLKPTSKPRWVLIQKRIVAKCGEYSVATTRDKEAGRASDFYIPEDGLHAISATSDIDKLVKS